MESKAFIMRASANYLLHESAVCTIKAGLNGTGRMNVREGQVSIMVRGKITYFIIIVSYHIDFSYF